MVSSNIFKWMQVRMAVSPSLPPLPLHLAPGASFAGKKTLAMFSLTSTCMQLRMIVWVERMSKIAVIKNF